MEKLSPSLSGIAGEYFVAAELSRRGFMASITLRNNDSIDIHASRLSDNKLFAIQVKTQQYQVRYWTLSKKAEERSVYNHFYVFVSFNGLLERPNYHIVPSAIVSEQARESHKIWLATPGKNGQQHNDSSLRKFKDINGDFLERWDLIT